MVNSAREVNGTLSDTTNIKIEGNLEKFLDSEKIFRNRFKCNLEERIGDRLLFDSTTIQSFNKAYFDSSEGSHELFQNNNFLENSKTVNDCSAETFKYGHKHSDSRITTALQSERNMNITSFPSHKISQTNFERINFESAKVKSTAIEIFSGKQYFKFVNGQFIENILGRAENGCI
jgi:hypothetical protein